MENLIFKVKGNEYTIEFPNVGMFRKIETLKQILSSGMYESLSVTNTIGAYQASDMIEMEANLTVLAPDLVKDLKCDSFSELGLLDYKELRKSYKEQFAPWWNKILDLLSLNN